MSQYFWDSFWLVVASFFLLSYLIVMFQIIMDLFRDRQIGGVARALWVIGLIVLPLLTALVYLVARGEGMGRRQAEVERQAELERAEKTATFVRTVAATSPAEQIATARTLMVEGVITEAEFQTLKAKALG